MPVEIQEQLNSVIDSAGWKLAVSVGFRELLEESKMQLMTNENLTEGERKGYIYARRSLQRGISSLYVKLNRTLPPWLEEIFNV